MHINLLKECKCCLTVVKKSDKIKENDEKEFMDKNKCPINSLTEKIIPVK